MKTIHSARAKLPPTTTTGTCESYSEVNDSLTAWSGPTKPNGSILNGAAITRRPEKDLAYDTRSHPEDLMMHAEAFAKGWGRFQTPIALPTLGDPKSGKNPVLKNWPTQVMTEAHRTRSDNTKHGVGLVSRDVDEVNGGTISWVDCDIDDQEQSNAVLDLLLTKLHALGNEQVFVRRHSGARWAAMVRVTGGNVPSTRPLTVNWPGGSGQVEFGSRHKQLVVLGQHGNGSWRGWSRLEYGLDGTWCEDRISGLPEYDEVPVLTLEQLRQVQTSVGARIAVEGSTKSATKGATATGHWAQRSKLSDAERSRLLAPNVRCVEAIVRALPNPETRVRRKRQRARPGGSPQQVGWPDHLYHRRTLACAGRCAQDRPRIQRQVSAQRQSG